MDGVENVVSGWWWRWVAVAEAWVLSLIGFSILRLPLSSASLSSSHGLMGCCCCFFFFFFLVFLFFGYGVDFWMDTDCGGNGLAMGLGLLYWVCCGMLMVYGNGG